MQSAGMRTRRPVAQTVDDTASLLTLHTLSDGQHSPTSSRRGLRTIAPASQFNSKAPSLIIQRPDPVSPTSSAVPSSAPSLIIQRHDDPSRPGTAGARLAPAVGPVTRSRKIEQLVPDYRPETAASSASKGTQASEVTNLSHLTRLTEEEADSTFEPPKFTIDLSSPPRERYAHVAPYFRRHNKVLQRLFDDLIRETFGKKAEKGRSWGRRLLRKLPSQEEQEELVGISQAWDVDLYLLVAFNVLLDSFMGCTSGGVRVRDESDIPKEGRQQRKGKSKKPILEEAPDNRGRMLHFRTLDWAMDPLRRIVCQYEYVAHPGGEVIARSLTYYGFVGVLTGVRKGLSLSLNFRPCHDASSMWKKACFRFHQLCVVLGFRRGIASELRDCLLPSMHDPDRALPSLLDLERTLPGTKSTAAYLIFSDGARTTTVEKDHKSAVVRSASDFIVALNHDVAHEAPPNDDRASSQQQQHDLYNIYGNDSRSAFSSAPNSRQPSPAPRPGTRNDSRGGSSGLGVGGSGTLKAMQADPDVQVASPAMLGTLGLGSIVEASKHRKQCIASHWKRTRRERGGPAVRTADVIEWMRDPELCSDETHYACIMDPARGDIVWARRWITPLRPRDPR